MENRIPESTPSAKVKAKSTALGMLMVIQSIWVSTVAVFCTITIIASKPSTKEIMSFALFMDFSGC